MFERLSKWWQEGDKLHKTLKKATKIPFMIDGKLHMLVIDENIIKPILEEHMCKEAFNKNMTIDEFKRAINEGKIEYLGIEEYTLVEELNRKGYLKDI